MREDEDWDVDDAIRAEIIEVDREKAELCRLIGRLHDEVDPCTWESRAASMTPERRAEIAKKAAAARRENAAKRKREAGE
jgi:hypothetical protein